MQFKICQNKKQIGGGIMNDTKKIAWLRQYFIDNLDIYTVPCLQRLINIRPDNDGLRGCTIALALTAFAVLDWFGYLLRNDTNAKRNETNKNLKYIFCEGACGLFQPTVDTPLFNVLYHLYRNGLVHQYFPKNAGISKAGNLPLFVITNNEIGSTLIPVMNVDALAESTLVLIENTRVKLLAQNEGNSSMRDRFYSRLCFILKQDRDNAISMWDSASHNDILYVDKLRFTGYPGGTIDINPILPE